MKYKRDSRVVWLYDIASPASTVHDDLFRLAVNHRHTTVKSLCVQTLLISIVFENYSNCCIFVVVVVSLRFEFKMADPNEVNQWHTKRNHFSQQKWIIFKHIFNGKFRIFYFYLLRTKVKSFKQYLTETNAKKVLVEIISLVCCNIKFEFVKIQSVSQFV